MPIERDFIARIDLPLVGLWTALHEQLRSLTARPRVVLVGVPHVGFAASEDSSSAPDEFAARDRALEWLASPTMTFVASIDGGCSGDVLAVALACDLRIATEQTELCFSSDAIVGVASRLTATIGLTRALELCLTRRRVSATEATTLGLLNLTVDRDQLADAIDDLTVALLDMPRERSTELKASLLSTLATGRGR